jgi:malonyl-CoA/methylmalonyl-CoA synthetase
VYLRKRRSGIRGLHDWQTGGYTVTQPASIIERASKWPSRPAIVDRTGTTGFAELLARSAGAAARLLDERADLGEAPVVYLVPPGWAHVAVLWGIWRAGGMAVPIVRAQAPGEWEYILRDTATRLLVVHDESAEMLEPLAAAAGTRCLRASQLLGPGARRATEPAAFAPSRRALMLYTSGTTSRPKGVVWTHGNFAAQLAALTEAWRWSADDRILHVLPLNHVHGLVNVLGCALASGATCEFLAPFDPGAVWDRMARGGLTLFMAVPTVYAKLLSAWEAAPPQVRAAWSAGARRLRLMVSGSAALPVPLLERWREITGHTLLERYGMTEIGMALSNPLDGERRPGFVGQPLPGVDVRLVDEAGREVAPGEPGEIEVRGPSVFLEYWRRPDATRDAFRDGWFRTGDMARLEAGSYRILGRQSVDIIKTGGHKVSALEVESVLREHPAILDCAVVGVPDDEWGERVAAAVVLRAGAALELEGLREWAAARLAKHKLPTRLHAAADLPRNAMGKVTKPRVREWFAPG